MATRTVDFHLRSLVVRPMLAILALPAHGSAASAAPAHCESVKLVAAGGAGARIVRCYARAARAGAAVDPACVGAVNARLLGPDYIRTAFLRARAADPTALLFYNDFLADGPNVKSDFIYALMVSLLAQGTPIDGVSFQMHLGGGFGAPPTREEIRQNLARFVALGLVVRISEMDVQIHDLPGGSADQLAQQRATYHDVVAACLDVPACDAVSFWGISDKYTWVKDYLGISDRPLPFDAFYGAKAAFFGVRDALLGY